MKDGTNEYGTPIGIFLCESCGQEFTVCPRPKNPDHWRNCLTPDCASYDPNRDVDVLFMTDAEVKALPVVGIDMIRARKSGVILVKNEGE